MKQISAFDLDHTLIRANTSLLFYYHLIKKGCFPPLSICTTFFYWIRHRFFHLKMEELHHQVFYKFLKGRSIRFMEKEVKEFLQKDFDRFFYPPSIARLREAQKMGHHTLILSNSPSFLVGPIASSLNVSEWSSSEYQTDAEGNFERIQSVLLGEGKALYLKNLMEKLQVSIDEVTAYSDSFLDLPFLLSAGRAVVVNPSLKMKKISKEKCWEIL